MSLLLGYPSAPRIRAHHVLCSTTFTGSPVPRTNVVLSLASPGVSPAAPSSLIYRGRSPLPAHTQSPTQPPGLPTHLLPALCLVCSLYPECPSHLGILQGSALLISQELTNLCRRDMVSPIRAHLSGVALLRHRNLFTHPSLPQNRMGWQRREGGPITVHFFV